MSLRTAYLFGTNASSEPNASNAEVRQNMAFQEGMRRELHAQNWANITYSQRCEDTFRLLNFSGSCVFTSAFFALMYPNSLKPIIEKWLVAQYERYKDDETQQGWVLYQTLLTTFKSFVHPQVVEPAACITQALIDEVVVALTTSNAHAEQMKISPAEPFWSFSILWPDFMCFRELNKMEGGIQDFTFTLTNSHIDKDICFVYLKNDKANQFMKDTHEGLETFAPLTNYTPFYKIQSNNHTYVLRSACVSLASSPTAHVVALASCADVHVDMRDTAWLFHDGGFGLYLRDIGVFPGMPQSILGRPTYFTLQYEGVPVNVWDAYASILIFVKQP